ncbi:MAG: hypothetical protein FRX49_11387 [Trebouxia sp. A1-2]|nr:MAG: hypothetical protein FRX49_11387 [Trebouxia sp. A1-2]
MLVRGVVRRLVRDGVDSKPASAARLRYWSTKCLVADTACGPKELAALRLLATRLSSSSIVKKPSLISLTGRMKRWAAFMGRKPGFAMRHLSSYACNTTCAYRLFGERKESAYGTERKNIGMALQDLVGELYVHADQLTSLMMISKRWAAKAFWPEDRPACPALRACPSSSSSRGRIQSALFILSMASCMRKGRVEHLHSLHAGPEADGFQLAAGVSQAQAIAVVLKLQLQVVHLLAVVAAPVAAQPLQPLLQGLVLVQRHCIELLSHGINLERQAVDLLGNIKGCWPNDVAGSASEGINTACASHAPCCKLKAKKSYA